MNESVAGVGNHAVPQFARRFDATSNERKDVATIAAALSMKTLHERISYVSAVVGVKLRALSRRIVGVVPPVFHTIILSSIFPTDFPMIRILNQ